MTTSTEAKMTYEILDWDSEFFGHKVARITPPGNHSDTDLSEHLFTLKQQEVKLVYCASSTPLDPSLIKRFHGRLVDRKTTYVMSFDLSPPPCVDSPIHAFENTMSFSRLESLAIQSGEMSRFAVDPNIPRTKFVSLYQTWIRRSVNREIAREILVAEENEQLVGMITLGENGAYGAIGLIAVDKDYRGRGYGEELVYAAQRWFVQQGYRYGIVVTQRDNLSACRLYEKCGYTMERTEYFYHFWL